MENTVLVSDAHLKRRDKESYYDIHVAVKKILRELTAFLV